MPNESDADNLKEFLQVIREVEKERGSRIWSMVHHTGHICGPTMKAIYKGRPITEVGDKIEILLHSPGGHPDFAYQAMKFFRRRYKTVNIIVPLQAKSAATLMCLGADKIYMGEFGDLGPIDIQIEDPVESGGKSVSPLDEFKSLEYMRDLAIEWVAYYAAVINHEYGISIKEALHDSAPLVTGLMRPIMGKIDPLEVGTYRRALAIGEEYGKRMLALTGNRNDDLVRHLAWGYPAHSFCIDYEEASRIGLPVERLEPSQDHKLTEAIFGLERGTHHGFASTVEPPPTKKKEGDKAKPVPARGQKANGRSNRRVNGSGDGDGKRPSVAS